MSNPDLFFANKKDLLKWTKKEMPEYHSEYLAVIEAVKKAGFSGAAKLLRRENTEKVLGFQSFLTELNLANLLLRKEVKDLCYEPHGFRGVDFSFEKILISVKNLQTKKYERGEQQEIERMIAAGGGKKTLFHKKYPFSETFIEVEKNELGTYTQTRTETGSGGRLDTDLLQMAPAMANMGEFEELSNFEGSKKVLFMMIQNDGFKQFHIDDIARWYFYGFSKSYRPLLGSDLSWYHKLFGKEKKLNTVNALIFMFSPYPPIWPHNCFTEVSQKTPRVSIYTKDKELEARLKAIFS